jgi:hypothetical protein
MPVPGVVVVCLLLLLIVWLLVRNRRQEREFARESLRRMAAMRIKELEDKVAGGDRFHNMFPCPEADRFRGGVKADLIPHLAAKLAEPNADLEAICEMATAAVNRLDELRRVARNYLRPN